MRQHQVRWIVLSIIVVLALLIGGCLIWSWGLSTVKDVTSIALSVITSGAILAGGSFAVFKLQLFRDLEPHLSISQEVSHRLINDNYVHIDVTSTLNNSSKVRVDVREGFFRVQQILPVTDEEVVRLYAEVFADRTHDDLQWPTLNEVTHPGIKNELAVEPGESHQEICEFILSSEVTSVLVYTYFHNSRYSEGSQAAPGWAASTIYDIVKSPSA